MLLLSAALNDLVQKILIFCIVLIAIVAVGKLVVALIRANKKKQEKKTEEIIEQRVEQRLMEIRNEYFVMTRNVVNSVGGTNQLQRGKYVLSAGESGETTFNVRLNGLVREYKQDDVVFLADDDTICAVSGTVLIKPFIE